MHIADAAALIYTAVENAPAGTRVHAVAEEAVPTRRIAAAIGAALGLQVTSVAAEDATVHFGPVSRFGAYTGLWRSTGTNDVSWSLATT